MKITIWSYANLDRVYGIVWSLASFLQEKGHEVDILYLGEEHQQSIDQNNILVRRVRSRTRRGLGRVLTFWWATRTICDDHNAIIMIGARSALFSWPFWAIHRATTVVFSYELDGDGAREKIANQVAKFANYLVEVNEHRARLRSAITRKPDLVVRNTPDRHTRTKIEALRSIARTPHPLKVMYGGLIAHYQGIDLLVKGFVQSRADELELIGNYEDSAYLKALRAIPLPDGKRLVISPPVPRHILFDRLWHEAAVLACLYPYKDIPGRMNCLNTKYAEPTKYYEYLLLGIPFITTYHPSLPRDEPGIFVVQQTATDIARGLDDALACSESRQGIAFTRSLQLPTYEDGLAGLEALLSRPPIKPS